MKSWIAIAVLVFIVVPGTHVIYAATPQKIPEQLTPWTDWVLHGHEEETLCAPSFNDADALHCDWPSRLDFVVLDRTASFSEKWLVQYKRWIQLPGNTDHWPQDVKVNGRPALVMGRNGVPFIHVEKGTFTITGRFNWQSIPEYVTVPNHTALVTMQLNGRDIPFPNLDRSGRLWLQAQKQKKTIENRLKLQVFRLVDDQIPPRIVTRINLDVAGSAREIVLGPVLPADQFTPLSLTASLPARLEPDGRLQVQVRPGQWSLTLTSRHIGPMTALRFNRPDDGFWPEDEIWSFQAQPNLRIVEIEGVPSIDPLQTSLPEAWRNNPAYRLQAGETMRFKEIKRGDPRPAPDQLSLQRNLWLRFDGSGYTIQDTISGQKKTNWRLEMNPPIQLGRVAVDGRDQFITELQGSGKAGVELRKGQLNLTADSEFQGPVTKLSVTGWDYDFQQVGARLFLPPGWRLISTSGIDNIPGTWVKRWTLLDFFIVLILTIAVARLYSKPMALLAFMALVLIYHEPGAPRGVWLSILVAVALLRHLPRGKFRSAVIIYQAVNILALIMIAIPFSVQQLRVGLYPQLEKSWQAMISISDRKMAMPATPMKQERVTDKVASVERAMKEGYGKAGNRLFSAATANNKPGGRYEADSSSQVAQYDPGMINQTGPGLPAWKWNSIPMSWSGPVRADQHMSFFFTGPQTNTVLAFVRVLLPALLALGIFGVSFRKGKGLRYPNIKTLLLLLLFFIGVAAPYLACAGEIPSAQMLNELQARLLEKNDCFPSCADISTMEINITPDVLSITMKVAGQVEVGVPVPGSARHWLPQEVFLDRQPVSGLLRSNDELWMLVPAGEHEISMTGKLPKQSTLQLPLPLRPHRVEVKAEGWTVEGVHDNGNPDNQLQFKRIADQENVMSQVLETGILPPFVLIERTLQFGLAWKVRTTIRRISPTGSAIVLAVPLLAGESVVTDGIRVKDGRAQINLDSRQSSLQWESILEKSGEIVLKHPDTNLWTEVWRLDVSPIFHVETTGIPVILHQQGDRWYPTWHPWPNEEVLLTISRPAGVAGQSITIDQSRLEISPGRRSTHGKLSLSVRSSQGGRHVITLPPLAQLQDVTINGQVQPIRQENRHVPLPIKPGKQEIVLQWIAAAGISACYRTPEVDLGVDSVNSNIDVRLPRNRWPLFMGGPLLGPAVLFWSVILIIVLVAFGLGRTGLTPLKFHHWLLLGIGMSQSSMAACLLVVGWLIALDLRSRIKPEIDPGIFNGVQIGLGILTVLALGALVTAISMGLLGHPDMNIVGNGSSSGLLRWYQDHSTQILPRAWVVSIPMFVYRIAMLAWALWISFTLIRVLQWGWGRFSEPVLWHRIKKKKPATGDEKDADSKKS